MNYMPKTTILCMLWGMFLSSVALYWLLMDLRIASVFFTDGYDMTNTMGWIWIISSLPLFTWSYAVEDGVGDNQFICLVAGVLVLLGGCFAIVSVIEQRDVSTWQYWISVFVFGFGAAASFDTGRRLNSIRQ